MDKERAMLSEISNAQHKHLSWKGHLMGAISNGQSDITPEKAACDKSCDFGRWFNGDAVGPEVRATEAWKTIDAIHASFHANAGRVLTLATTGRSEEAKTLLAGEFGERADHMLKALSLWKLELKAKSGE
ncbi:CZB domain-containing protein [Rhodovulum visakhapatnamense]|uniref:Chemoreceptor zinc-binding protein n=1 Tax=Rhodovulum visakhapatnamense TaxID=364297 RepID=A0A4V3GSZ0_9RHOB|nr:CZB domain-containing protein [Rhodovulum visakhapatnamense]TDX24733.1 chemoreceptor zinc-binding protein [Rhodovulum visakhapatnamense]